VSRTRSMTLTIPTRALRSLDTEVSRRLAPLVAGIVVLLLGGGATGFGIALINDRGLWPDLTREVDPEWILFGGIGLLVLGLMQIGVFAFRRTLVIRFDVGGSGGARIHLRRSWSHPMPFRETLDALATIARITITGPASVPSDETRGEPEAPDE